MIPDARTDREYEAYAKEQRAALAPVRPIVAEQQGGDVLQKVRDIVTAWNWGPAMTDRDAMVAICQLVGDNIQSPTAAP